MLKELKLSNFRLFSDEITVRFRPITIFIGRNNAGKSSVIKFLLMLKQSLGVPDNFLITNGNEVSLGRWGALKNKGRKKRDLRFTLEVSNLASPSRDVYGAIRNLRPDVKSVSEGNTTISYSAKISYSREAIFTGSHEMSFSSKGRKIIKSEEAIDSNSSLAHFSSGEQPEIKSFCTEGVTRDLNEIKHLSATREEFKSLSEIKGISKYVGKNGESAALEMWANIAQDKERTSFINKHAKIVLGIKDITFKEHDDCISCFALNEQGNKISISSFGFGVSQCFPIFVQGALMLQRTHLIVEQPEAQVHLTSQLEMGSFFVDLWKEFKVSSIVETHSNNMIMRIGRHIVEGDLDPEDVSVAYFHTDAEGKSTVENLDIESDGFIKEGLPIEFFGANVFEGLQMRRKK